MNGAEIRAALIESGIAFSFVAEQVGNRVVQVSVSRDSHFTYDVLAKLAALLGTTDMRIYYEGEHAYSEVTFEGSSVNLWIRMPTEVAA